MSFTLNQHDPRENVDIYPEDQRKVRMERTNQAFTSLTNFVQLATIGGFDSVGTHPSGTGKFGCVHLVKNKVNQQFCVMKVLNKIDTIRMKQVDHTKNELEVLVLVRNHHFFTQLFVQTEILTEIYKAGLLLR